MGREQEVRNFTLRMSERLSFSLMRKARKDALISLPTFAISYKSGALVKYLLAQKV
jgi:hypothetical protein